MKRKLLGLMLMVSLFATACSSEGETNNQSEDKIQVYTSIYPLNYIVEEIAGEEIELNSIVPEGTDPHEYEISLKDVAKIREADLLIYNGAGLETWGEDLANEMEPRKVMVASEHVNLIPIEDDVHNHGEDDHEDNDEGNKNSDPHIWLSPQNMKLISQEVEKKLSSIDPENSEYFKENSDKLVEKLDELDSKYREELEDRKTNTILVSHKAFGYLAKEYDIEQIAVTGISPRSEPTPKEISNLIDIIEEREIDYIFFEILASPKSVEMLSEEANLDTAVLNPIGGLTSENIENKDDYITIMEENLENLKKELLG